MSDPLRPRMTESETALLQAIVPQGGRVLEFGAGGSTQFFFEHGVQELVSVESDGEWLKTLVSSPLIRLQLKYGRWLPLHVDIGPTGAWGAPVSSSLDARWLEYHLFCWSHIENKHFDLALIDGRFRVACACQVLFHCTNSDVVVAFHDFWIRQEYHAILEFFDQKHSADSLCVMTPKPDLDWKRLGLVLQEHLFCDA